MRINSKTCITNNSRLDTHQRLDRRVRTRTVKDIFIQTHLLHGFGQMFVELLFPVAEFLDVPLQVLHGRFHLGHFGLGAGHLVHQLIVLQWGEKTRQQQRQR